MSRAEDLAASLGIGRQWREVIRAAPREVFVPDVGLACPEQGAPYSIDRRARPEEWLSAVYSDASIITQREDGRGDPLRIADGMATSSISAPGIAFRCLELLAPRDHDRVLEVGTGTGYTTAVLSARVGDGNVTTVEVDPEIAERARVNIAAAGFAPRVVVGDGLAGAPDNEPYDRVHVTAAVAEVPFTWVEQTRPGGVIVAPWQPLRGHGLLTRLTVTRDGAYGRFHGPCGYMLLRSQRAELRWRVHHEDEARVTATTLDPRTVWEAGEGLRLAAVAMSPGLAYWDKHFDDGSFSLCLFEIGTPDGPWAACDWEPGHDRYEVTQYGDRHLWDELEDAFEWWVRNDGPGVERFGLTATPEGDRLWLDRPTNLVGTGG
ncbi:methyltransferase domain-containing protein [Actinomadura sp. WMMB 499]|uniref:methyltransferase domain-containing protein n=1 Tax=Actinomadura sp. WMMB 499 TaxID=1219491 RepID=UPI001244F7CF|nr:methyltransferase domain-containing protein [Actinomadura sp. WMMB 499]QFG22798.1 methyltransferase domain-containing protein [Actinomadura sp. WMMB 499]